MRVLVVEDESIIALDLRRRLDRLGHTVIGHARTGTAAVELALSGDPQIILMDIRLQGEMDGIEAAERIQAHKRVPVVFLSAHTDDDNLERVRLAGAYGFVLKPFDERELVVAMTLALHKAETERALRQEQQWHSGTLDALYDGVITIDEENRIRFANLSAGRLLGVDRESLAGSTLEERLKVRALREQGPQTEDVAREHGRLVRDGGDIAVELTSTNIRSDSGQRLGSTVVIRDIELEEEYLRSIKAARDEAIAAVRSRSDFIMGISHELRTPLNSIIGMADLVADLSESAEQREYLTILRGAADTLLGLINSILDLARLQSGGIRPNLEPGDLYDDVDRMMRSVAVQASQRGLRAYLIVDPRTELGVRADFARIDQILLSLLSNAAKFTKEGYFLLRVEPARDARDVPDGHAAIRFSVVDTGPGIAPDEQSKVWERYVQLDKEQARVHGGVGIGLTLTKELVTHLGGTVELESEVGKGSSFSVTMTFERSTVTRPAFCAMNLRQPTRRVAVVTSDTLLREAVVPWLEHWGCRVAVFDDVAALPADPAVFTDVVIEGELSGDRFRSQMDTLAPHTAIHLIGVAGDELSGPCCPCGLIRLPRLAGMLAGANVPSIASSPAAPGLFGKILLVDDNRLNRVANAHLLERLGLTVVSVENGREAVEKLKSWKADVVLMDLEMPVMNGYEAAEAIRAGEAGESARGTVILALTAHATDPDRDYSDRVGMDGFISKPLQERQVRATIGALLRGRSAPKGVDDTPGKMLRLVVRLLEKGDAGRVMEHLQELRRRLIALNDSEGSGAAFRAVLACRRGDTRRAAEIVAGLAGRLGTGKGEDAR